MERDRNDDAHRKKSHPCDGDAVTGEAFRCRPRRHERQLAAIADPRGYIQKSFALRTLFFHRLPALICLHDELLNEDEQWICGTDPRPARVPDKDGTFPTPSGEPVRPDRSLWQR